MASVASGLSGIQGMMDNSGDLRNTGYPVTTEPTKPYPPEFFRRQDESEDRLFYVEPRLVVHIDEHAITAIGQYLSRTLPPNGAILDLMSSWRSHLPEELLKGRLVGLGLNGREMSENPQLDEHVVHDVNADPHLPFDDESFDAALITVSIQYLIRPVEVFREVHRTLRGGASLHVIYSNRCFPTKAVAIWQTLDPRGQGELILGYFSNSGGWDSPHTVDISPRLGYYSDPVHVVAAKKS